jgi:hypothetical protein
MVIFIIIKIIFNDVNILIKNFLEEVIVNVLEVSKFDGLNGVFENDESVVSKSQKKSKIEKCVQPSNILLYNQ